MEAGPLKSVLPVTVASVEKRLPFAIKFRVLRLLASETEQAFFLLWYSIELSALLFGKEEPALFLLSFVRLFVEGARFRVQVIVAIAVLGEGFQ